MTWVPISSEGINSSNDFPANRARSWARFQLLMGLPTEVVLLFTEEALLGRLCSLGSTVRTGLPVNFTLSGACCSSSSSLCVG